MKEVNISESEVSVRTVRRFLNSKGFWYLQTRKKGLLSDDDRRQRIAFAKKMQQEHGNDFLDRENRILFGLCELRLQKKPFGSGEGTYWKNI